MDRKSCQSFHIMGCAKLKSAGLVLSAPLSTIGACFFFCEETRFGSLPISIPLFLRVGPAIMTVSHFSNIKGLI